MGEGQILSDIGWFFSKLAVVTFGGAYAVLAYMGQDVVTGFGWLEAGQMMDGLGLAETTPGPLILVTEFVGYLAAYQQGGQAAIGLGIAGAIVALVGNLCTLLLWIFAGAPYIEWISAQPRLKGALSGITAAVVGVILNLSLWFALHVFFGKVELVHAGPLSLWTPELATLDWRSSCWPGSADICFCGATGASPLVLAIAAALALLLRWGTLEIDLKTSAFPVRIAQTSTGHGGADLIYLQDWTCASRVIFVHRADMCLKVQTNLIHRIDPK